ncbi:glycosyl transferase [Aquisalinus flavus]|uniref:Glycosyl transferase n=1 Tax=Aquisalinus flavus TaxID=1526572 RepID=A0A8J2V7X6_9PROT|nr:glycosyltransferase family 4 protein [Aquisalinus flavus]GGD19330.1 glycosyl transferase [Aquisalinus flavus]
MNAGLEGRTILQVIPELETGGAERTTLEVAEAVIAVGGRALVVSQGGPMVAELEGFGARHIEMPVASKNPLVLHQNRVRLEKLIRAEGVALVHARSRAPAWSAHAAARAAGVPFITTYHGIYRARSGLKRAYNAIMARGDYVIANSHHTAAAVLAEHSPRPLADPSRLIVIHRGADLRRFSPDKVTVDRVEAIEKAWDGGKKLKILLPGRLTEWKGQHDLIAAAQILRETRQAGDLRIVLAGSDQGRSGYRAALEQAVGAAGLEQVILLPGNCDDMPAALSWADLVISASRRPEAFGRVAIEAQAMARPVIATGHGGAMETVVEGKTGWLYSPGDAAALAERIAAFAALSGPERQAIGAAARENAAENFSVARMTERTLQVYCRALGLGGLGSGGLGCGDAGS